MFATKRFFEPRPKIARQVGHLRNCIDALFVKPVRDLPGAIGWLAQLAQFLLQLVKLQRLDVDLRLTGHKAIYGSVTTRQRVAHASRLESAARGNPEARATFSACPTPRARESSSA